MALKLGELHLFRRVLRMEGNVQSHLTGQRARRNGTQPHAR